MNDINYSAGMLRNEYDTRVPIRQALHAFMSIYRVFDKDVLELGSGLGHNLEIFAENNRVKGVEGLPDAAAEASRRGVQTIPADIAKAIPLPASSFDVVLCLDILEHLVEPGRCLSEVHHLLRPQGLLVVNVPNHFSLTGRLNIVLGSGIDSTRFFPSYSDWENPHVRFFRHSSINELIRQCQFKIEADWSNRFPSIPLIGRFQLVSQSRIARFLARSAPELFAGGFFSVARRSAETT